MELYLKNKNKGVILIMNYSQITLKELKVPESIPFPKRTDWHIGMIGFGGIAIGAHAPAYQNVGWNICAVADPNSEARRIAQEKYGIQKTYSDFHELINDDAIEVIDLLTQPTIREEVVKTSGRAGKPIITEKPFARSVEECERMIKIADDAGIKLAVHQNYRWMKMNYTAHHIIKKGLIGDPFFASIEIFGTQDVDLAGHEFYSSSEDFLTIQWNNHLADLLRYWTGKDADRVFARTGRMKGQNFKGDNLLCSIADFGDGLTGHILHSELLRSHLRGTQCRVDGSKGSLKFDFHNNLVIQSEILGKESFRLNTKEADFTSSFAGSMGDFLISIEQDKEPSVSGRRNLATIKTVSAEHESSMKGGKWINCKG
ncbi:hypothetical protein GF312_20520 [Candidatus Poribacteria bacterium]|nr:hypothetical protein [Candidatus Poribacteria bacterium]